MAIYLGKSHNQTSIQLKGVFISESGSTAGVETDGSLRHSQVVMETLVNRLGRNTLLLLLGKRPVKVVLLVLGERLVREGMLLLGQVGLMKLLRINLMLNYCRLRLAHITNRLAKKGTLGPGNTGSCRAFYIKLLQGWDLVKVSLQSTVCSGCQTGVPSHVCDRAFRVAGDCWGLEGRNCIQMDQVISCSSQGI